MDCLLWSDRCRHVWALGRREKGGRLASDALCVGNCRLCVYAAAIPIGYYLSHDHRNGVVEYWFVRRLHGGEHFRHTVSGIALFADLFRTLLGAEKKLGPNRLIRKHLWLSEYHLVVYKNCWSYFGLLHK